MAHCSSADTGGGVPSRSPGSASVLLGILDQCREPRARQLQDVPRRLFEGRRFCVEIGSIMGTLDRNLPDVDGVEEDLMLGRLQKLALHLCESGRRQQGSKQGESDHGI